uniref:SET domain-containing protein n=1 Tax=Culex tarsalis TaxID=7177 RepID=A0A1Q3EWI9_CULTA
MACLYSDSDRKVGRGFDTLMHKILAQFGDAFGFALNVELYRDFALSQQTAILDVPEQGKCNRTAAQMRQEGNRLYVGKKLDDALIKYNESICFAEAGSDQLGMAFANRSAVFFEQGEYEFALANIALAKRHKYPENLMPKLVAREHNCREKLESKKEVTIPRMAINVNVNPKIPFVADGITMKVFNDEQGRGLVAEREFQAGAVILDEKAVLTLTTLDAQYSYCGHCGKPLTYSLIPCPGCVSFSYCSEECLQENERFTHRFECAIADKLRNVMNHSIIIGAKQFFYGLTLFGDDVQAMMEYCNGDAGKGVGNPFELDFRKKDRLEQFKVMQKGGVHHITDIDYNYRISAAAFYVVFMKHPLVAQIVKTKAQRNFMLHTFLKYNRSCHTLIMDKRTGHMHGPTISVLPFVGALCNHSCDPNVVFTTRGGRYTLVVLRPIRKGEQIVTTYGPTWWEPVPGYECTYTCRCPVCRKTSWTLKNKELPQAALRHLMLMTATTVSESSFNNADQLNMAQQFVNRYAANYHPSEVFGGALRLYRRFLDNALYSSGLRLEKLRAVAAWEAFDG